MFRQNMKTITSKPNQTVYDIALEQYGNVEAVGEIVDNNPHLVNDPAVLVALGINMIEDDGFYIDAALLAASGVRIDTDSPHRRPNVIRELTEDITTFDL